MQRRGTLSATGSPKVANIEAVMIAGQWRKREHTLLHTGLDEVKDHLPASGRRLLAAIRPSVSAAA